MDGLSPHSDLELEESEDEPEKEDSQVSDFDSEECSDTESLITNDSDPEMEFDSYYNKRLSALFQGPGGPWPAEGGQWFRKPTQNVPKINFAPSSPVQWPSNMAPEECFYEFFDGDMIKRYP